MAEALGGGLRGEASLKLKRLAFGRSMEATNLPAF